MTENEEDEIVSTTKSSSVDTGVGARPRSMQFGERSAADAGMTPLIRTSTGSSSPRSHPAILESVPVSTSDPRDTGEAGAVVSFAPYPSYYSYSDHVSLDPVSMRGEDVLCATGPERTPGQPDNPASAPQKKSRRAYSVPRQRCSHRNPASPSPFSALGESVSFLRELMTANATVQSRENLLSLDMIAEKANQHRRTLEEQRQHHSTVQLHQFLSQADELFHNCTAKQAMQRVKMQEIRLLIDIFRTIAKYSSKREVYPNGQFHRAVSSGKHAPATGRSKTRSYGLHLNARLQQDRRNPACMLDWATKIILLLQQLQQLNRYPGVDANGYLASTSKLSWRSFTAMLVSFEAVAVVAKARWESLKKSSEQQAVHMHSSSEQNVIRVMERHTHSVAKIDAYVNTSRQNRAGPATASWTSRDKPVEPAHVRRPSEDVSMQRATVDSKSWDELLLSVHATKVRISLYRRRFSGCILSLMTRKRMYTIFYYFILICLCLVSLLPCRIWSRGRCRLSLRTLSVSSYPRRVLFDPHSCKQSRLLLR